MHKCFLFIRTLCFPLPRYRWYNDALCLNWIKCINQIQYCTDTTPLSDFRRVYFALYCWFKSCEWLLVFKSFSLLLYLGCFYTTGAVARLICYAISLSLNNLRNFLIGGPQIISGNEEVIKLQTGKEAKRPSTFVAW